MYPDLKNLIDFINASLSTMKVTMDRNLIGELVMNDLYNTVKIDVLQELILSNLEEITEKDRSVLQYEYEVILHEKLKERSADFFARHESMNTKA